MKYRSLQTIKHALIEYRKREEITEKDYARESRLLLKIYEDLIQTAEFIKDKNREKKLVEDYKKEIDELMTKGIIEKDYLRICG